MELRALHMLDKRFTAVATGLPQVLLSLALFVAVHHGSLLCPAWGQEYLVHYPSLTAEATVGLLGKMDSFLKSASIPAHSRLSRNPSRMDANSGGDWQVWVEPVNTLEFPRHFYGELKTTPKHKSLMKKNQ